MDWLGAFLGGLLLRTTVGSTVVLGMYYLLGQQYVFAVGLLLPLLGIVLWVASDSIRPYLPDSVWPSTDRAAELDDEWDR